MSNHTSGNSYLGIFWVSNTAEAAYPTGLKYSALSVALVASCVGLSAATLVLAGGNKTKEEDHQQQQDDSGSSGSDASPLAYLDKFGKAMGISAVTVSAVALIIVAGIVACLYAKQPYHTVHVDDVPSLIVAISACMAVVGILSLIFGSVVAASFSSSSSSDGEDDDGADAAAAAAGVSYALIGVSAVAIICAITDPFKWGSFFGGGGQMFSGTGPAQWRENPDA